ncbi:PadR family transcriptional regulator [Agromyces protaetiae]|uniref:PadR family transcriptional regulator n=1 Tax=Agromyces protaetiae TaxID=2509455 RepID=A0A4P6FFI6_9MICO|nr:PadR family transcriptional regulator [Agromyces protaetiae]
MNETDDLTAGHLQELRRGTVVLACLLRLREPDYGYALLESLGANGIAVDANTLYPLLRRLEKQGLLTSEWNTDEARPRKFYRTSTAGDALARILTADWQSLDRALARFAETSGDATSGATTPGATTPVAQTAAPETSDTEDPTTEGDPR